MAVIDKAAVKGRALKDAVISGNSSTHAITFGFYPYSG